MGSSLPATLKVSESVGKKKITEKEQVGIYTRHPNGAISL